MGSGLPHALDLPPKISSSVDRLQAGPSLRADDVCGCRPDVQRQPRCLFFFICHGQSVARRASSASSCICVSDSSASSAAMRAGCSSGGVASPASGRRKRDGSQTFCVRMSAQGTQGRSCTHGYFSVFLRRHPQVFFPVVGYEATSRSSLFQDCRNGGEFLLFRLLCGTGNRRRICRVGLRAGFSSPGPRPVSARERALLVCTGKGPFRRVRTAGAFTFEKGKTRGAAQRRPVRTGWKNTLFP